MAKKLKMFAVYSHWGYHAFYQTEELARKHWKGSKKYRVQYSIFPCKIIVEDAPTTKDTRGKTL